MVAPARRPLRSSLEGSAGMSAWEPVIGLEMHVELDTRTKMFCACEVTKGDEPNTHTCPKCLAHPGALVDHGQRAVEDAARIALALNCSVRPRNIFHRKNYFYPDLPKAYQISQYDEPLAVDGWFEYWVGDENLAHRNAGGLEAGHGHVTAERLAKLVKLVADGTVSTSSGKDVFARMIAERAEPEEIVEKHGLGHISDTAELEAAVARVVADNPAQVEQYRGGKQQVLGFFVGQVM